MFLKKPNIVFLISFLFTIFLICFINKIVILAKLSSCDWPDIGSDDTQDSNYTNVMLITDIHLRTDTIWNYTDNVWREYLMSNTYSSAKHLFRPQMVVILGDIFDDGINYSEEEFNSLKHKFNRIFSYDKRAIIQNNIETNNEKEMVFVLNGNHDIGWHYEMTKTLKSRFDETFHTHSVQHLQMNGLHFVAINSITMERDYCKLCAQAEEQLIDISHRICSFKNSAEECPPHNRPVVLTHYPLFKDGRQKCGNDWDIRPDGDLIWTEFVQKWNCFHRNATEMILKLLNPRLVFNGHTHYGCVTRYAETTIEWTVASFNYANTFSPTIILLRISANDYSIRKCVLTHELVFYFIDSLILFSFLNFWFKPNFRLIFYKIFNRFNINSIKGFARIDSTKN